MARFKYMGTADRRQFLAGEDFDGRLPGGLPRGVVISWDTRHIIDSDAEENKDLPGLFFELLADEPGFEDVSAIEPAAVPLGAAERLWKGMRDKHDTRFSQEGSIDRSFSEKFPTSLHESRFYDPVANPTGTMMPDGFRRPAGHKPNDDITKDDELPEDAPEVELLDPGNGSHES